MSKLKSILPLCCALLCVVTIGNAQTQPNPQPAPVQATSPEVPYLRAIVEEVRQLRVLLQQTMISSLRARILTEQLAKQQNRVETLTEEINQTKALISQAQESQHGEDDLQEMETQIRECADPQECARLRQSYATLKRALERERAQAKQEAEKSYGRQMQLENLLRGEQAKLAELQGQLEDMDREMEKLATEGKLKR